MACAQPKQIRSMPICSSSCRAKTLSNAVLASLSAALPADARGLGCMAQPRPATARSCFPIHMSTQGGLQVALLLPTHSCPCTISCVSRVYTEPRYCFAQGSAIPAISASKHPRLCRFAVTSYAEAKIETVAHSRKNLTHILGFYRQIRHNDMDSYTP